MLGNRHHHVRRTDYFRKQSNAETLLWREIDRSQGHAIVWLDREDVEGQKLVEVKLYSFVKEINLESGGDWCGCMKAFGA